MNRKTYDAIVVGLGGVGSSAAYHLAKRGVSVLGIDQFSPPHAWGSSHGQTRVIRQAYFEHPSYVPLLKQAYGLWDELESESGRSLFRRTGVLQLGPTDGVVIPGVLRSAREHGLPVEAFTMQEATDRFKGIRGNANWSAVLETNAGYLLVQQCVEAHLQQAQKHGANLVVNEEVIDWHSDGTGITVQTDRERYRAKKLILACGPWASRWLRDSNVPLTLLRKHVYWFDAPATYRDDHGFPTYFFETSTGYFYGTPIRDDPGLKVARHSGGEQVSSLEGDVHREDKDDRQSVEEFLGRNMPGVTRELRKWVGCYYTMTSDENFIVDRLPRSPHVTVVAGLSGHGFKFTSVLGKIASDMTVGDEGGADIEFLRLSRLA